MMFFHFEINYRNGLTHIEVRNNKMLFNLRGSVAIALTMNYLFS